MTHENKFDTSSEFTIIASLEAGDSNPRLPRYAVDTSQNPIFIHLSDKFTCKLSKNRRGTYVDFGKMMNNLLNFDTLMMHPEYVILITSQF